jgi:GNAT superfamily N-acetyltransferase
MLDLNHQRSGVSLRAAIERLPAAELDFAHFNAYRTAIAPDTSGIVRGETPQFAFLLDAGRPTSSYYNRAVARTADPITASALTALPAGIIAIETGPVALTPDSAKLLLAHRFVPQQQLCYLGCGPTASPQPTLHVERLGPTQVDTFFDLLGYEGVMFTPEQRAAKRQHYCTDQFHAYVARGDDGAAYGWATLFIGEGVAFFGNAYTLPAFRRSGAHRALLLARLAAAKELGATIVYADVEHQSQSYYNCTRAGFCTINITTIWVRES